MSPSLSALAHIDSNIVYTFDGPVFAGTGFASIKDETGRVVFQAAIGSDRVSISGSVLTIDPPENLSYGSRYFVSLDVGFLKDSSGNALAGFGNAFDTELNPLPQNLTGTPLADNLRGGLGNDYISGGTGDDRLLGEEGDDRLYGDDGFDRLLGGKGSDDMHGGSGGDRLDGEDGNDQLYGDDGDDQLYGGNGDDTLEGGTGNDQLFGDAGNNVMRGGLGDDVLESSGTDILEGGDGADRFVIRGTPTAHGASGDDRFFIRYVSGAGTAAIYGDEGRDLFDVSMLVGSRAALVITGGADTDTYVINPVLGQGEARFTINDFQPGPGGDLIDLAPLMARYSSRPGNPFDSASGYLSLTQSGSDALLMFKPFDGSAPQALVQFANVQAQSITAANFVGGYAPSGSADGLTLYGTSGNDQLTGGAANDKLYGGDGSDSLTGGGGNDYLEGGSELSADGNDSLNGGDGNDILVGGAGNDSLEGGNGDDQLDGGSGNDTLVDGGPGTNILNGGAGDDVIYTRRGGTIIADGGDGNDTIRGGFGTDSLFGGAGDDTITVWGDWSDAAGQVKVDGGAGRDTINFSVYAGSLARVVANGGAGADTFVFEVPNAGPSITIADFSGVGGDKLDLTKILPASLSGNPFGSAGYLRASQNGADTVISFDADGAAGSATSMTPLVVLQNTSLATLSGANFVGGISPSGSEAGMTLTGTSANDVLKGGPANDILSGLGGNDSLYGAGGADILYGGDETGVGQGDQLHGGDGNDQLYGGAGDDVLFGDAGNDSLSGGAGADQLDGGDGDDNLDGGSGNDVLSAGLGNDILSGGDGDDQLWAGGGGNKVLDGGNGSDALNGGNGNDTLIGGAGDDKISIWAGANATRIVVSGGDGNDLISLDGGNRNAFVEAHGGQGQDTYYVDNTFAPIIAIDDFTVGKDGDIFDLGRLVGYNYPSGSNPFGELGFLRARQDGLDTLLEFDRDGKAGSAYGFQTVAILKNVAVSTLSIFNFTGGWNPDGSTTGYNITGTSAADLIKGSVLDDTIDGKEGDDDIYAGPGNDHLEGGPGNDHIDGQVGDDVILGGDGNDSLSGGYGNDYLEGGEGNDVLSTQIGNSVLIGGNGNDSFYAGNGEDRMYGGEGDDQFFFNVGGPAPAYTVTAEGGSGNDSFSLRGVSGKNATLLITGGEGRDTYSLNTFTLSSVLNLAAFVVTDFAGGEGGDLIDMRAMISWYPWGNPFDGGGPLRFEQRGSDAILQFDTDHTGPKPFQDVLVLKNIQASAVTAANFVDGLSLGIPRDRDPIIGTPGADHLTGGALRDYITGGGGNDVLDGGASSDLLSGGDGDDVLTGGAGDDRLDGGAGIDTAVFAGSQADYKILTYDGLILVRTDKGASEGADSLLAVERLHFDDRNIAFDLDANAGQAFRLYQAAFNRAPDLPGFGFWIKQMDRGMALVDVAHDFLISPEGQSLYGANPSDEALLTAMYNNVLHRSPDAEGFAWWLGELKNGLSHERLLIGFSESIENKTALIGVMENGVAYIPYAA